MKNHPFRDHHILTLLAIYEEQHLPLDLCISNYFRANKALGSKDRGVIAETVYAMIRWLLLIDHICSKPVTWQKRLEVFNTVRLQDYQDKTEIPWHVRLSFPKVLVDLLIKSHGEKKTAEICKISNRAAPTTVRANTLKTTRNMLLLMWKDLYSVAPCKLSESGIVFLKKINLFGLEEFRNGLFEVQDEGSQLLANLMEVEPGQLVMDYCSGSGGKTLAFAPRMNNKGQIYLHDIRKFILGEAKKRLKRAGIQNAQVIEYEDPKLKKLKKKMDWILVDAPCTGTGTMRRNPDMKWDFSEEMVIRLQGQQRVIFEKALSYLKPGGKIVYATCSVLNEENQDQIAHFMKTYNLKLVKEPFQSLPIDNGMDGFFGAVLTQA